MTISNSKLVSQRQFFRIDFVFLQEGWNGQILKLFGLNSTETNGLLGGAYLRRESSQKAIIEMAAGDTEVIKAMLLHQSHPTRQ